MDRLIVYSVGFGIGSAMLIYPVTYLILRRRFNYKYRWTSFLIGFGIASVLSGFTMLIIEDLMGEMALAGILIPLFFSIIVILGFNTASSRGN